MLTLEFPLESMIYRWGKSSVEQKEGVVFILRIHSSTSTFTSFCLSATKSLRKFCKLLTTWIISVTWLDRGFYCAKKENLCLLCVFFIMSAKEVVFPPLVYCFVFLILMSSRIWSVNGKTSVSAVQWDGGGPPTVLCLYSTESVSVRTHTAFFYMIM